MSVNPLSPFTFLSIRLRNQCEWSCHVYSHKQLLHVAEYTHISCFDFFWIFWHFPVYLLYLVWYNKQMVQVIIDDWCRWRVRGSNNIKKCQWLFIVGEQTHFVMFSGPWNINGLYFHPLPPRRKQITGTLQGWVGWRISGGVGKGWCAETQGAPTIYFLLRDPWNWEEFGLLWFTPLQVGNG